MPTVKKLIAKARASAANLRFAELVRIVESTGYVLDHHTGSHWVFHRAGSRSLSFQEAKDGKAKKYQVEQVLAILESKGE